MPRVYAKARPAALPQPVNRKLHAFAPAEVTERYGAEAAGVRPSALAAGDNVITMFEDIGYDFWTGGGVTSKKVAAQLRAIGDRPVEVQINSPGGDMFEGISIYNVLREHPQPVTVKVMGMAASAASIIAMAGDTIEIGTASFFMVHNCWVVSIGNRHDMAETAEWLAPFDAALRDVYAERTGQPAEKVAKWMDSETWISGSQAVEWGFADALLSADTMTIDEDAKAADASANELRGMERALVASGLTRAAARAKIEALHGGKRDAAQETAVERDADGTFAAALSGLLNSIKD